MSAVEDSHRDIMQKQQEIVEKIKPLSEIVSAGNVAQKTLAAVSVLCSIAVAVSHWMHR